MPETGRERTTAPGRGYCRVHGAVEGPRDSRGRARCAVQTCRRVLAIHAPTDVPPRNAIPTPSDAGDSNDAELRQLTKELRMAELRRKIREVEAPLRWEKTGPEWDRRLGAAEAELQKMVDPRQDHPLAGLDLLLQRVKLLEESAGRLKEDLQGDPLVGVRGKFVCEKCGAAGFVGVKILCTMCPNYNLVPVIFGNLPESKV